MSYRSQKIREVLDGVPVVLVEDGVPDERAMRAERVPEDDILSEARQVGIESMSSRPFDCAQGGPFDHAQGRPEQFTA